MKVMVMAGTSDASYIINKLANLQNIEVLATTTTSYGRDIALNAGADDVIVGRLGLDEIIELMHTKKIKIIVDATHPFAVEATLNALKAARKSGIRYIRFERPSTKIPENELVKEVSSFKKAAITAANIINGMGNGNVRLLHLAGVSTLRYMSSIDQKRIVVRVLPALYSIKKCQEMDIPGENIIAMQGTFSKEFNKAIMEEYSIGVVVTKESGETGGTPAKIDAALALNIPVIIVKRPVINELQNEDVFNHIDKLISSVEKPKK
jgi:precorrin-6A/cobalt-precorrin-6A reductase